MAGSDFPMNFINWLRAGYPNGFPDRDFLPIFALLGSRLTHDELRDIAAILQATADEESVPAIRAAIEAVTHGTADDVDINTVIAHLDTEAAPLKFPVRKSGSNGA